MYNVYNVIYIKFTVLFLVARNGHKAYSRKCMVCCCQTSKQQFTFMYLISHIHWLGSLGPTHLADHGHNKVVTVESAYHVGLQHIVWRKTHHSISFIQWNKIQSTGSFTVTYISLRKFDTYQLFTGKIIISSLEFVPHTYLVNNKNTIVITYQKQVICIWNLINSRKHSWLKSRKLVYLSDKKRTKVHVSLNFQPC